MSIGVSLQVFLLEIVLHASFAGDVKLSVPGLVLVNSSNHLQVPVTSRTLGILVVVSHIRRKHEWISCLAVIAHCILSASTLPYTRYQP